MTRIVIGDEARDATDAELAALDATRPSVVSADAVRAEVHRRILARASYNTQINMAAAAAAGRFTGADADAFQDALDWVDAMRTKGQELVADPTYADDSHWPEPTAAAIALAARF